jgi:CO/xanthine dehydrogenase FAD-binding subunit
LDLNTIAQVVSRPTPAALDGWTEGDAWLGGGTYLFSEPQVHLRRLIDLDGFGWTPIEQIDETLSVAATCKLRELYEWPRPASWTSGHLIPQCCNALLGSFKIWNMATVGGNICLSLPAGPMTSLAAALGATCVIWQPGGGERRVLAHEFVTGNRQNVLRRGELLRSIEIPIASLTAPKSAFRQVSLTWLGRSAALLIGRKTPAGGMDLTVTAATVRPIKLFFASLPSDRQLADAIAAAIPDEDYHDDIHGLPAWRRHLTFHLAEEIRQELSAEAPQ